LLLSRHSISRFQREAFGRIAQRHGCERLSSVMFSIDGTIPKRLRLWLRCHDAGIDHRCASPRGAIVRLLHRGALLFGKLSAG